MITTTTPRLRRLSLIGFSFLFFTLACCNGPAMAQRTSISDDDMQELKKRTVVFVLPQSEYKYFDDYQSELSKIWNFTPFKVIKYHQLSDLMITPMQYAIFLFGGISTTHTKNNSGFSYTNTHFYLTLSVPYTKEKKNKVKIESDELCRIELYPDFSTTTKSFKKDIMETLYTEGKFRNFNLPYMLAYLRVVQKNLEKATNPWVYSKYTDDALMGKLRTDTLYVIDSTIFDRNKFNGKESLKEKKFFESYGGRYKYVSVPELINMIRTRPPSKPLFLFEYVLSSTDKYVSVLEVNKGIIVYRRYVSVSYNIKEKDLKDILD